MQGGTRVEDLKGAAWLEMVSLIIHIVLGSMMLHAFTIGIRTYNEVISFLPGHANVRSMTAVRVPGKLTRQSRKDLIQFPLILVAHLPAFLQSDNLAGSNGRPLCSPYRVVVVGVGVGSGGVFIVVNTVIIT